MGIRAGDGGLRPGVLDRQFLLDPPLFRDRAHQCAGGAYRAHDGDVGRHQRRLAGDQGVRRRTAEARRGRAVPAPGAGILAALRRLGLSYHAAQRRLLVLAARGVHGARRQHRAHPRCKISPAAARAGARGRAAGLFPMGDDAALGLGADRLSLGLSREPETLADRRPADPQRPDAAVAGELLREFGPQPRPDRARLRPPGPRPAAGARHPRPAREQPDGRDLSERLARVHQRVRCRQQPARRHDRAAIFDVRAESVFACRMRIRISHDTVYRYESPPAGVIQVLRLTPRNHDGQYVVNWRIDVSADCRLDKHEDAFGNITHAFAAEGPLPELSLLVEGEVETRDANGLVRDAVERFPPSLFLRETELTACDAAIAAFAASARQADGDDALKVLHRLLERLHDDMELDPDPTYVATKAAEA